MITAAVVNKSRVSGVAGVEAKEEGSVTKSMNVSLSARMHIVQSIIKRIVSWMSPTRRVFAKGAS